MLMAWPEHTHCIAHLTSSTGSIYLKSKVNLIQANKKMNLKTFFEIQTTTTKSYIIYIPRLRILII